MSATRAGQLGWLLFGAASAFMVWQSIAVHMRPVVVAVTVLWWLLLSLPALRRGHRPAVVVINSGRQQSPTA